MAVQCGACGAVVTGRFCGQCGAPAVAVCPACGATPAAGARFCAFCGTALVGAAPRTRRSLVPLVVAGIAGLTILLVLLLRSGPAPPPSFGESSPPDLSAMTPLEQFDRLYERVMTASERGDTATAIRFAPMALLAYRNLPASDLTADSRFHAALIRLHTGDPAGAQLLADSILAAESGHLFGFIVRNGVGRALGNAALVRQSYQDFLAHVEGEMRAGRPEYQLHQTMLDNFQRTARQAVGGQ